MILKTVLLLGITMAWYDKPLPKPLDQSESYRSASGALGMGVGVPAALHAYWNKKRPSGDEQVQLKRTLATKGISLLLSLMLQRGKARHDQDPAYLNSCMANAASIPLDYLYFMWRAKRKERQDGANNKTCDKHLYAVRVKPGNGSKGKQ